MGYSKIDDKDLEKVLKRLTGTKLCSIAITAGASTVATFTIQFAERERTVFDLYMSTDANGANLSATGSTALAATTGTVLLALSANKMLRVITDATGKAVITLTAAAKPQGERMCVVAPNGTAIISAATVTASYGA